MRQRLGNVLILFFLFLLPVDILYGQQEAPEKRLALVIGNADYLVGPLANPVNDARSMARALRNVGFDVMLRENVSNQTEMKRVIREFGQKLKDYDIGLFYYAGHGIQVKGYNFLVPVNARISSEEEVEYECVDAGFVVALMDAADSKVNIIVLDACRNNPFARTFRSTRQGLVSMNAPAGTIIAYATSPGKTAIDGSGVNGLYTQELLYQIQRPGLKIEDVFKNVRIEVMKKSDDKQVPWESSSLTGDFYFKPTPEQLASFTAGAGAAENNAGMFWKADQTQLVLKINGREIKNPKTYPFGNDMIAEDPQDKDRYLLRNYWNNRDGRFRIAEKLPATQADFYQEKTTLAPGENENTEQKSPDDHAGLSNDMAMKERAKWKADKTGTLWFVVGEKDVSNEIEFSLDGADLKVYYPGNGAHYKIRNFTGNLDNRWRMIAPENNLPANTNITTTLPAALKIKWRATHDGTYYLYVNGMDISRETTYKLKGDDLYVFHPATGRTYLLKNFVNRLDNRMRKGILLKNIKQ